MLLCSNRSSLKMCLIVVSFPPSPPPSTTWFFRFVFIVLSCEYGLCAHRRINSVYEMSITMSCFLVCRNLWSEECFKRAFFITRSHTTKYYSNKFLLFPRSIYRNVLLLHVNFCKFNASHLDFSVRKYVKRFAKCLCAARFFFFREIF